MDKFYSLLLSKLEPLTKWIGKVHVPWSVKKITGRQYYLCRDKIRPGHIFLTTTDGQLSNLFNPSRLKHGGLFVGGSPVENIVEAVGKGVVETDLISFMTSKDQLVVVKPKFGNSAQHAQVCREIHALIGYKYDYEFESGDKEFYCFEAIIHAYKKVFPNKEFKTTEVVKNKKIYDSTTFTKDPENWEIVVDLRK